MKVRKVRLYVKGKMRYFSDYVVSRSGRVFRWSDGKGTWKGREINVKYFSGNEYPIVSIWDYNLKKTHKIRLHSIVAHTFLGRPPKGKEINHKDGIKKHCHLSNLEYVTRAENTKHAYDAGLLVSPMKGLKGDLCPVSRMSSKKVDMVRKMFYCDKIPIEKFAYEFYISVSLVDKIVKGKNWNYEGFSLEELKRRALKNG